MNTTMNDTQTSRDVEQLKNGDRGGPRAEALADRIEEGAAGLAAFAEGLPESEWCAPVPGT